MLSRALRGRLLAGLLLGLLPLTGCSGDPQASAPRADASESSPEAGEEPGEALSSESAPEDTQSAAPGESPYLPVPAGVRLTAPGSKLRVGDTAVLATELPGTRKVGVFEIRVDRLLRAGWDAFEGWVITEETRSYTPYFVRVSVRNAGRSDLGGEQLPLYAVNDDNMLLQPSPFERQTFQPCHPAILPEPFGRGEQTEACLVYLAPDRGDLVAVSFRPDQSFNPITWTGTVSRYRTRAR